MLSILPFVDYRLAYENQSIAGKFLMGWYNLYLYYFPDFRTVNGREQKVRNNPYESGSGKENSGIMLEAMLAEGTLVKESLQGVSSVGSYTSCPECDATLDGTKTSFEKHFVDHHK